MSQKRVRARTGGGGLRFCCLLRPLWCENADAGDREWPARPHARTIATRVLLLLIPFASLCPPYTHIHAISAGMSMQLIKHKIKIHNILQCVAAAPVPLRADKTTQCFYIFARSTFCVSFCAKYMHIRLRGLSFCQIYKRRLWVLIFAIAACELHFGFFVLVPTGSILVVYVLYGLLDLVT